jgi:hypothetical protein
MAGSHEKKYVKEFKKSEDDNYSIVIGEDNLLHVADKESDKCLCNTKISNKSPSNKDFMMYKCHKCSV